MRMRRFLIVALLALAVPPAALARGKFDPTTEFEQHEWVSIHLGGLNLSITKAVAYLMLGTAMFGIATIVLLPTGIYQALSSALITSNPNTFRQAAGEALSGGLASLPLWLAYLWLVTRAIRAPSATMVA